MVIIEREVLEASVSSIRPLEYTDPDGGVIGMNGARINQLLAEAFPNNLSFRDRLENIGLVAGAPVQQIVLEGSF